MTPPRDGRFPAKDTGRPGPLNPLHQEQGAALSSPIRTEPRHVTPRPDQKTREALKARMAQARKDRDAAHERIEEEFWKAVAAELADSYHGAQADIAEAIDYTRDHILKSIKKHTAKNIPKN
jgi:hypothetical protein